MDDVTALEIPKERCLIVIKSDEVDGNSYEFGQAMGKLGFAEGSVMVFLRADDDLSLLTDDRLTELGLQRIG